MSNTVQPEIDSGVGSEDDSQNPNDLNCNCELCHARMYVSMKQSMDEDYFIYMNHPNMGDGFHILPQAAPTDQTSPSSTTSAHTNNNQNYCSINQSQLVPPYSWHMQFSYLGELQPSQCSLYGNCTCYPDGRFIDEYVPGQMNMPDVSDHYIPKTNIDVDPDSHHFTVSPQVYISKDIVIHIRLSNYVAIEFSGSAYRLINYRNNSAIALSDTGEYGYAYHYNCRGLINMHHEKLSISFDKDRQILLRTEKPSFVKKEQEFYRLTTNYWSACRPISMDNFDKDRTPDILKRLHHHRTCDEARLREIVSSSIMHPENGGLIIFLGDARIEQKVNGDVQVNWMYDDRANCMIVSPLAGSFSLSTSNLEIITTPKNEIYISFLDFFVHVGNHQMTVSYGNTVGRGLSNGEPCPASVLNLNSGPSEPIGTQINNMNGVSMSFMPPPPITRQNTPQQLNSQFQPDTSVLHNLNSNICITPTNGFSKKIEQRTKTPTKLINSGSSPILALSNNTYDETEEFELNRNDPAKRN